MKMKKYQLEIAHSGDFYNGDENIVVEAKNSVSARIIGLRLSKNIKTDPTVLWGCQSKWVSSAKELA